MDTRSRFLQVPGFEPMDKYTASIELSNACRQFYQSRVEAANCIKTKWEKAAPSCSHTNTSVHASNHAGSTCDNSYPTKGVGRRQRNSIDEAMEKLRTEMASLMDQDLSLMKQLLTLNETIEELKWQRRYYYSRNSVRGGSSSQDLDRSDWSVSDTEMYESDEDVASLTARPLSTMKVAVTATRSPVISSRQSHVPMGSAPTPVRRRCETPKDCEETTSCRGIPARAQNCDVASGKRFVDTEIVVNGSAIYHGEQDSFDSGIHESTCEDDSSVSV